MKVRVANILRTNNYEKPPENVNYEQIVGTFSAKKNKARINNDFVLFIVVYVTF